MIRATELRIGNYYMEFYDEDQQEYYIANGDLIASLANGSYSQEVVHPIEITPEWLIKLGFIPKAIDRYWERFQLPNGAGCCRAMCDHEPMGFKKGDWIFSPGEIEVKSLHHLQNVYYAIIGKELTIETK